MNAKINTYDKGKGATVEEICPSMYFFSLEVEHKISKNGLNKIVSKRETLAGIILAQRKQEWKSNLDKQIMINVF